MNRFLHVLLLVALFLGPQVGVLVAHQDSCQDASNCCSPNGVCDVNCVVCECYPGRLTSLSPEPISAGVGVATTVAGALALPLLATDILHVPKSL